MMINQTKKSSLYCLALASTLVVSCGKKTETETVYVPSPKTTAEPVTGTLPPAGKPETAPPAPTPPAPVAPGSQNDALAVVVKNSAAVQGQRLPVGPVTLEFGLAGATAPVPGVVFKCKIEQAKVKGLDVTDICTSPKTYQIEDAGQYVVTIFAVHESSGTTGLPIQIEFGIGTGGQPYPNANANFGTGGMVPENALLSEQVGDLFSVSIPQGFHLVSRTSTFDTPGFLTYQFINGGSAVDSAMPYAYRCSQEQEQFTTIDQLVMSSGASFEYCTKTPSLAWNSPATPIGNQFRWDTMSTMSYNSIVIASDNSLKDRRPQGAAKPTMAKLSANVFTNVTGVANDSFSRMFATELNQTVSRMNVSCAGQKPVFLGNAMIFEGYFQWNPVMSPLFGCVTKRNSQWYVEIGAFPMDQNRAILPNQGWTPWIGQDFGNTRAAEIVVEVGPFPYAPAPESVAPDAQALMLQNMKKLLPSPAMDPVTPIITPGPNPCNPCEPRRRFWNRH